MLHRRALVALAFLAGGLGSGCVAFTPDKIHYEWDAAAHAPCAACAVDRDDGEFVGLAFSGGGSRAAVFAAAGAEALAAHGVLDRVTHISSVSGGSFTAAYLAALPSDCGAAPDRRACEAAYFAGLQEAARANYFRPTEARQAVNPNRFLSPTRRVVSLTEVLDRTYLDGRTFGDLPESPVLLINAASFDDARRFVFSNRVIPDEPEDTPPLTRDTLRASSFALPGCPYATPDDFPISLAVATSAAFPPALGPVAIEVAPGCGESRTWWRHLGDGGILENTGVETLREVIVRRAAGPTPPPHAVVFAFSAGKSTSPEEFRALHDLRLWTSDPGRVVDIVNRRGDAYADLVWNDVRDELGVPTLILTFRYTDAEIAAWPASCRGVAGDYARPSDRLGDIPTRLAVTDCDADLLREAANVLVRDELAAHADALAAMGFTAGAAAN